MDIAIFIVLVYIAYRLTRLSHTVTHNQVTIFEGQTKQFQNFKQELRKEFELRLAADEPKGGKFGDGRR